jgi:molybdenum cofactor biosynthesis enzyme MoaA
MNPEAECEECRRLLDSASNAITRQLRGTSRLDLAKLRHEDDMVPALEAVVREATQTRAESVLAYKAHRRTHDLAAAKSV